ncbi:hypothetical protein IMW82_03695 [Rhodanobacter sp. B2A1Ga4]|uniref:hypothetical protein n=1 Tax=Rhodanobacter sp. B2A1Ga4 TaxID=2778647 RepID=UPI001B374ECA|nr:hypothetical protein [Rhodanobacter sp. B2A1Ga4]MBQ4853782.1 hypothetical protein [Rhodanobacter sp. B2A1Ga4]
MKVNLPPVFDVISYQVHFDSKEPVGATMKILHIAITSATLLLFGCSYRTMTPDRYYQYDLNLEIEGKPVAFSYNWHCHEVHGHTLSEENWNITSGTTWVPARNYALWLAKPIGSQSIVLFSPNAFCIKDAINLDDNNYAIGFIRSAKDLSTIDVYDKRTRTRDGSTLVLKSATIRQLDHMVYDTKTNTQDVQLKAMLVQQSKGYELVSAVIAPESTWSKFDSLSKNLYAMKVITAANTIIGGRTDGYVFFPGPHSFTGNNLSYVPLRASGGVWRLDGQDTASPFTYHAVASARNKVNYRGLEFELLNAQEVYDPQDRVLIEFVRNSDFLPPVQYMDPIGK